MISGTTAVILVLAALAVGVFIGALLFGGPIDFDEHNR